MLQNNKKFFNCLNGKKVVIFDWNGTLYNDVDICVSTISLLLVKYGLKPISKKEYLDKFCFPVIKYYESLGFNFNKENWEKVADEFMNIYRRNTPNASLYPNTYEIISKLKSQGKKLFILSASKLDDLLILLKYHCIDRFFDHVFALSHHYATGKLELGNDLLNKIGEKKSDMILVGDTDHDVEVAKMLNIDCVILSNGHQSLSRLQALNVPVIERYS